MLKLPRQDASVAGSAERMCCMCGATPRHGVRLHIDHVTPWSNGGETVLENLQVLCEQCNVGKSSVDLRDVRKRPRAVMLVSTVRR
jgi:5-methylcytosine-specific restriction endonuclease McrA